MLCPFGCPFQVVAVHTNVVKPRSADVNENLLSETARNKFGLTDEQVKNAQPLENVLEEVVNSTLKKYKN